MNKRIQWVFKLFLCIMLVLLCSFSFACNNASYDKTIYEKYIEKHPEYTGDEQKFLEDLLNGNLQNDDSEKSVYELYKEAHPEYTGDEKEFLEDLLNNKLGIDEKKSVYELYKEAHPEYEGTEEEFYEEILGLSIGKKNQYNVTFKLNEDDIEPYMVVTVDEGNIPYFPKDKPDKKGYNFVYWGYDGYEWPQSYPIVQDTIITAVWEPIEYNVNYFLDGGSDNINPDTYTIEEMFELNDPHKDYYKFDGWYSSNTFDEKSKVTKVELGNTGDIDLYAKWTPIKYTISYEGIDGAKFDNEQITSYNYETADINLPNVTKDYYEFLGWTGNGITEPETNVVINSGSYGDITLVANWKIITYKISYDLNGGINSEENKESYTVEDFNETDVIQLTNPSRNQEENIKNGEVDILTGVWTITSTLINYKFKCWVDSNENEVKEIRLGAGDVKVIAVWESLETEEATREAAYYRNNDTVMMGILPQSEVTDADLLTVLNNLVPDDTIEVDITGIKQKELTYNGNKYMKAYGYDGRGSTSAFRWFKYEPVKWSIANTYDDGSVYLICNTELGYLTYGGSGYWQYSNIREFLNSTGKYEGVGIYDTLFTDEQRELIQVTHLDNSKNTEDVDYSGNDTDDKIFLPSVKELRSYGLIHSDKGCFSTNSYLFSIYRKQINLNDYDGFSRTLLGNPYSKGEKRLMLRSRNSGLNIGYSASVSVDTFNAISPAMRVKF